MKYFKIIIVFIFCFFIININCNASSNTYTRTKDKLLVPNDVVVDENNINNILKTPAVSSSEKIYDFADIYTDNEEEILFNSLSEYINNSSIDAVIVTTNNLEGFSISDYAYNFYDYNNFKNDGIILVIFLGQKEPEIYMGNSGDKTGKVFTIYNDKRVNDTLAYIYNDIQVGNYYAATTNYIKIINGFYNIDRDGNYRVNSSGDVVKSLPWIEIGVLAVTLTFILVMFSVFSINKKNRLLGVSNIDNNINTGTMMLKIEKDELVDTKYNK